MTDTVDTDFYLNVGLALIRQGYQIVPIKHGLKHPGFAGWQELNMTEERVRAYAADPDFTGWGVKCQFTAGIDADIYDVGIAKAMQQCMPVGAPIRVGNYPKILYVVANPDQARKRSSRAYIDGEGRTNKVEVLRYGQQFVTHGTHPDTGNQYYYHGVALEDVAHSDLPVVTEDELDVIFAAFETLADAKVLAGEWTTGADRVSNDSAAVVQTPFENIVKAQRPGNFTTTQIISDLKAVASRCDRDKWVMFGAAIHHQFQGDEEGFDIFHQWSQIVPGYESEADCRRTWDSFNTDGRRNPVTFASVHKAAQLVRRAEQADVPALPAPSDPSDLLLAAVSQRGTAPTIQQPAAAASGSIDIAGRLDPDFDPMQLERRQFVIGRRLLRKFLTVTVSPGGVSKSMFSLLTAVSVAMDLDLTGEGVHISGPVWVVNNEDDISELYRRLYAICLHYSIDFKELTKRLHVDSGYLQRKIFAAINADTGTIAATKFTEELIATINNLGIIHLVVDPFVSLHTANENDNVEIEQVTGVFKRIAASTGCSLEIVHHTRKTGGNSESHAGDAESSRGASALINAARTAVTMSKMSAETAEEHHIDHETEGVNLVRLDDAKMNYAPASNQATWFRLVNVSLPNGDDVGVHEPYDLGAVRAEVAEEERAARDALNTIYRNEIANAMGQETSRPRPDVVANLQSVWHIQDRQIINRINVAVYEEPTVISHNGVRKQIWRSAAGGGRGNSVRVHLEVLPDPGALEHQSTNEDTA